MSVEGETDSPRQDGVKTRPSPPRLPAANLVEALPDRGEAGFDHRLEFKVGKNIAPVLLDAFADELADICRVDAVGYALVQHPEMFLERGRYRTAVGRRAESLRQVAVRVHDVGPDEARTQNRYADPARGQLEPQALRQRDDAIFGDVVGHALTGDQAGDRGGGDDVAALAVLFEQRPENLDPPHDGHQIHADRPIPFCV